MKKIITSALAFIMILSVCLAMSACGKTTIVGKWQVKLDPAKLFSSRYSEETDDAEETSGSSNPFEGVEFSGDLKMYLEFTSEGKFDVSFDEEDFKNVMSTGSKEEFVAQMLDGDDFESKSGEYKYSDGELSLGENKFKVDLAKKTLVLKELVSTAEDEEEELFPKELLPLTFDRVS